MLPLLMLSIANFVFVCTFYLLTLVFYANKKNPKSEISLNKTKYPLISIIVPARNEETKILRCLNSLVNQSYPNFEIIVIDDRSQDSTGKIIKNLATYYPEKIKVVEGIENPNGWVGKCNALCNAVAYASGEYYAFTDADTCHNKDSIFIAYQHLTSNKLDLVSFIPVQEFGSQSEKIVMPTLLSSFLLGDVTHSINKPNSKVAYAYGQYIFCTRSAYVSCGGHQSVRDEIVEDFALGKIFKERGFNIGTACGLSLYSVRMYQDLTSMWNGWTKNLFSLVESSIVNVAVILFFINFTVLTPFLNLSYTLWYYANSLLNYDFAITPLFKLYVLATVCSIFVLFLWYIQTSKHFRGLKYSDFFKLPLGAVLVSALFVDSTLRVLMGTEVNWKGRTYKVNSRKTIAHSLSKSFKLNKNYSKMSD